MPNGHRKVKALEIQFSFIAVAQKKVIGSRYSLSEIQQYSKLFIMRLII